MSGELGEIAKAALSPTRSERELGEGVEARGVAGSLDRFDTGVQFGSASATAPATVSAWGISSSAPVSSNALRAIESEPRQRLKPRLRAVASARARKIR